MSSFPIFLDIAESDEEETFLSEITFISDGTPYNSLSDVNKMSSSIVLADADDDNISKESHILTTAPVKKKALSMIKEVSENETSEFNEHQLQTDFEKLSLNTTLTSGNIDNAQWHSTPIEKSRNEPNEYRVHEDHSRVIAGNLFNETAHLLGHPRQSRGHLWSQQTKIRFVINVLLFLFFFLIFSAIIFALKYFKKI